MSVVTLFPFPGGGGGATDPYFDDVILLVGANGTDGSTSFTDESSYAHTVSAVGDAQIDTAQSKFDGASLLLDGSGDYLSVPQHAQFRIQTDTPFTIECWARFNAATNIRGFVSMWDYSAINIGWGFYISSGQLRFRKYQSTTSQTVDGAFSPTLGQWYHLAVDRDASNIARVYADGAVIGSGSITGQSNLSAGKSLSIGQMEEISGDFDGNIDEVRFTQGVARYGGAFTPPTERFPRS